MEPGKIVFEGKTPKGKPIIVRYPNEQDAALMRDFINRASEEQTFIRFQGEKVSLEEEEKYLQAKLKEINDKKAIMLLAFSEEKLIGSTTIEMKEKIQEHEGVFGIIVDKDFRGEGLGSRLITDILKEAEARLPKLQIVTLEVFGDNPIAKKMYQKFGFKEHGRLPGGIRHKENYVDAILMYKPLKQTF